jgi:hypothetical protein
MTETPDLMFVLSNRVEAGLWLAIALALTVAGMRRSGPRLDLVAAAIAFALFGMSDLIEATTGAWWRPWWLLVWKGGCVLTLIVLLRRHAARRRRLKVDGVL